MTALNRPALGLLVLAGVSLAGALALPAPWSMVLAAVGLILVGLALLARARRAGASSATAVRLDLERLRPGRLRDACRAAVGYHSQLHALAETLPSRPLRAALAADLPTADAVLRTLYAVCLGLQGYELGEVAPPTLTGPASQAATLAAAAEETVAATVATLSQTYTTLRRAWSGEALDPALATAPLAGLLAHRDRLRDLAASFAAEGGPSALQPTAAAPTRRPSRDA